MTADTPSERTTGLGPTDDSSDERVRRSRDTFYNLIQGSPFGVYLVDADFRLAQVSVGARKVFENVRPLLGRDFHEVIRTVWPEPFASEALDIFHHTLATGEPYHSADTTEQRGDIEETESYDWQIQRVVLPDGRHGVVCYFYDFTELRHAQDALRDSEERFRSMANAAPTIIWTAGPSGAITFHNQRWLEYTGLTSEHEDDWRQVLHPDDVERCVAAWTHALETGEDYEIEVRNRRFDGQHRWFVTRAMAQRDAAGNIDQWVGSSTDIHDRMQLEERLRERELAERRARLDADFLADLVGELEAVRGVERRARRLVELLVPRVADSVSIVLPGDLRPVAAAGDVATTLRVPLAIGPDGGGTLALGRSEPPLSDSDVGFVGEIAERAALLLTNARLQEEEHGVALRLQRALLPNRLFRHPRVDVAARYDAGSDALEVGGDWYDCFGLDGDRIGIAVGDVVGHGLDAAAAMGRMRTALAALAMRATAPAGLLEELNAFAAGPNGTEFATACYAVLDPTTGSLTYASAGHPPMLHVDREGRAAFLTGAESMPLGLAPDGVRREARVELEPGSLLVVYTDGLVERRGERLEAGLERLERLAVALREEPVETICAKLIVDLGLESGNEDDTVVMAMRLSPTPAPIFSESFPAAPEELRRVRAAVRGWLRGNAVSRGLESDLVLAVSEACANAVEHAYAGVEPGTVEVRIAHGEPAEELLVQVRDFGRWRDPPRQSVDRGHGTRLMKALVDHFDRKSGSDGTTVRLRVRRRDG